MSDSQWGDRPISRRPLLRSIGATGIAALAGCLGDADPASKATPTPIDLDGGKQDDQGGMIIGEHFGPNGQLFYRDHTPKGHDNPAWFHTLAHGFFPYYFEHERLGWELSAMYVTDYSSVDYELTREGDRTFISTHTAAETFGDAAEMRYVTGSDVLGGMGPELVPFGAASDAEAFKDEHGGGIIAFEDITDDTLLHRTHDHDH